MKVINTELNGKAFLLAVAENDKQRKTGLSKTAKLKKGAGMVFVFDKEGPIDMNMYKMNYALDMVFMDKNWDVVDYSRMHVGEDIHVADDVKYVIEVNAGELSAIALGSNMAPTDKLKRYIMSIESAAEEKIKSIEEEPIDAADKKQVVESEEPADEPTTEEEESTEDKDTSGKKNIIVHIDKEASFYDKEVFKSGGKIKPIEDKVKLKSGGMQVLDDAGVILMNITGGERIFSREHTAQLVALAEKVKQGKASKKELGKLMSKIIDIQDTQAPEYVYE